MTMKGKIVVVTGANQGIGKVTAAELARQGARVLLVCRNAAKGKEAMNEILASGGEAELVIADLSSQAQVRAAAAEIKSRHERLDVLVNNAGVLVPERRSTVDGVEETLALNHLAYFLLTHELMDLLRAAGKARIVNVSSAIHRRARPNFDDIQFSRGSAMFKVYGHSKLLNILFTYELARRLEGTGITANCLHPGAIGSGFGQTYGGLIAWFVRLGRPFLLTPEQGARTSIYLASSPEVEGVTGKYYDKCKAVRSNDISYDRDAQKRLWEISEKLVGIREDSLWARIAKGT